MHKESRDSGSGMITSDSEALSLDSGLVTPSWKVEKKPSQVGKGSQEEIARFEQPSVLDLAKMHPESEPEPDLIPCKKVYKHNIRGVEKLLMDEVEGRKLVEKFRDMGGDALKRLLKKVANKYFKDPAWGDDPPLQTNGADDDLSPYSKMCLLKSPSKFLSAVGKRSIQVGGSSMDATDSLEAASVKASLTTEQVSDVDDVEEEVGSISFGPDKYKTWSEASTNDGEETAASRFGLRRVMSEPLLLVNPFAKLFPEKRFYALPYYASMQLTHLELRDPSFSRESADVSEVSNVILNELSSLIAHNSSHQDVVADVPLAVDNLSIDMVDNLKADPKPTTTLMPDQSASSMTFQQLCFSTEAQ